MSGIVPPTTIPEPEGHTDTGPSYEQLRARTLARRALAVALLFATIGIALLLAGPTIIGLALFLPGFAGALIAESRLARHPGGGIRHYVRPPYYHGHEWTHFGGGDWGGGDCGGGGGDGGGGGG
jgi:uncharacterized membrane protein YgcG